MLQPIIIGITGGSASGKTYITNLLVSKLNYKVLSISLDNFYKPYTKEQLELIKNNTFNFDNPLLINYNKLINIINNIKQGKDIKIPIYCYKTTSIINYKFIKNIEFKVIIIEGLFLFNNKELFNLLDIKLFIDTTSEIRFKRRLERDNNIRNRDNMNLQHHLDYYINYVIPSYNKYILPNKYKADLIINGNNNNSINILYNLLDSYINLKLLNKN